MSDETDVKVTPPAAEEEVVEAPAAEVVAKEGDEPTNAEDVGDAKAIKEHEDEEKEIDVDKLEIETRGIVTPPPEYGEDVDEDDIKTIGTIVDKQTAGVRAELQATKDGIEVDNYVREQPEMAKYKPAILKYMNYVDPKDGSKPYSRIPVRFIAAGLASGDLMKMGAKAERVAQSKADATKTKGGAARSPEGSKQDWKTAPKADFEAQKRAVLQQH